MKGLELPINMIVVIAIAVLVLVVVAAFFAGRLGGGQIDIQRQQALSEGCRKAATLYGCDLTAATVTLRYDDPVLGPQGTTKSVLSICTTAGLTERDCRITCGCPVSPTGGGGPPAPPGP